MRKVASFVGQIISMNIVIEPVSQIMTRHISMDILNSYIKLSTESCQQLLFWQSTLECLNVRNLSSAGSCSRVVYSDASGTGFAGYEKGSTWREVCAVFRVLRSLVHILCSQRAKWFTDSTNVVNIVNKGSMVLEL